MRLQEDFVAAATLCAQISFQAKHFVNLEVHISWRAQHFADLELQKSWQAQPFVNLDAQILWQAQHFVNLEVQISWRAHFVDLGLQISRHPAMSWQRGLACTGMASNTLWKSGKWRVVALFLKPVVSIAGYRQSLSDFIELSCNDSFFIPGAVAFSQLFSQVSAAHHSNIALVDLAAHTSTVLLQLLEGPLQTWMAAQPSAGWWQAAQHAPSHPCEPKQLLCCTIHQVELVLETQDREKEVANRFWHRRFFSQNETWLNLTPNSWPPQTSHRTQR